jgi:hypothetical protein
LPDQLTSSNVCAKNPPAPTADSHPVGVPPLELPLLLPLELPLIPPLELPLLLLPPLLPLPLPLLPPLLLPLRLPPLLLPLPLPPPASSAATAASPPFAPASLPPPELPPGDEGELDEQAAADRTSKDDPRRMRIRWLRMTFKLRSAPGSDHVRIG